MTFAQSEMDMMEYMADENRCEEAMSPLDFVIGIAGLAFIVIIYLWIAEKFKSK
jgi:hypothetical protein